MATYLELHDLKTDSTLLRRVEVACWIAAEVVRTETPATTNHAARLVWAAKVLEDPKAESYRMLPALLAGNKGLTIAALNAVTDAAIQSAVNAAVDLFAR